MYNKIQWRRYSQFRTFKVIAPPIMRATTCTASPTDLSSVVLVVENPYNKSQSVILYLMMTFNTMSSIIIVENELTTPFGIALLS